MSAATSPRRLREYADRVALSAEHRAAKKRARARRLLREADELLSTAAFLRTIGAPDEAES